jgi:hypothetical protein
MSRGKKKNFQKGGGINIVFGPKFRPLLQKKLIFLLFFLIKKKLLILHYRSQHLLSF